MTQNRHAMNAITCGGKETSNFQAAYAFVALISFVLGTVFSIIDGMLLWAILFFALGIIIVLMKIVWNVAIFAENAIRKLRED